MNLGMFEEEQCGSNINSIAVEADDLKEKVSALRKRVKEVFSDKTIPLEDRWSVWTNLPDMVKEESWHIVHFAIEEKVGDFTDSYERHDEIYLADFVGDREYDLEYYTDRNMSYIWTRELIDEFKEEILKENLGSFKVDW